MGQYALKVALSVIIIVAVSELAKRNATLGALLASLPLTSLLAFIWLYHDTGDVAQVATLARAIFWLVLPSLALFVLLPVLLRNGYGFWPALGLSSIGTIAAYSVLVFLLPRVGIIL